MEKILYDEMVESVANIDDEMTLQSKKIFLFGHCNATLELFDHLESKGLRPSAILDNSSVKQGKTYKGVEVISPYRISNYLTNSIDISSVVLIASRFFDSMLQQLREIGFKGQIRKVIDYNTYSEYSLEEETIARMKKREEHGEKLFKMLSEKYRGFFKVFCPFNALGDIYFMISYWSEFAKKRDIRDVVFCVTGRALSDVIHMFGDYPIEIYEQKELDAMIQSSLYTQDKNSFIAHQDRPYVVNLGKALYKRRISLEEIYCCGVYGLPVDTLPSKPMVDRFEYGDLHSIPKGKAVVFSPYAKSVTAIDPDIWSDAVDSYRSMGYKCYTNVSGNEMALSGTEAISPSLLEIRSVVERAGTFVGVRSGLCDILREANAKKIALYPDYYYCDTKWKSIEIYNIKQFEYNLLATKEIEWEKL